MSARRRASLSLLLLLTIACGRESDPMDAASIERDLEKRTVRELYEEAEQLPWRPPDDFLLTEAHIADFVKVATLAEKIMEVAGSRFDEQIESASRDHDRFARMGTAFAAIGSMRAFGTAHLRAALTLDVNPNQQQWVLEQIIDGGRLAARLRPQEEALARAERELKAESVPYLRERKEAVVRQAKENLRSWEKTMGDTELANARLVQKHRTELARFFPFLARQ
ncbi:MAG: hypothetical protein ACXWH7_05185 [Thermoanaerobaculia bacterium]